MGLPCLDDIPGSIGHGAREEERECYQRREFHGESKSVETSRKDSRGGSLREGGLGVGRKEGEKPEGWGSPAAAAYT